VPQSPEATNIIRCLFMTPEPLDTWTRTPARQAADAPILIHAAHHGNTKHQEHPPPPGNRPGSPSGFAGLHFLPTGELANWPASRPTPSGPKSRDAASSSTCSKRTPRRCLEFLWCRSATGNVASPNRPAERAGRYATSSTYAHAPVRHENWKTVLHESNPSLCGPQPKPGSDIGGVQHIPVTARTRPRRLTGLDLWT
jgi:hypothetical protein